MPHHPGSGNTRPKEMGCLQRKRKPHLRLLSSTANDTACGQSCGQGLEKPPSKPVIPGILEIVENRCSRNARSGLQDSCCFTSWLARVKSMRPA